METEILDQNIPNAGSGKYVRTVQEENGYFMNLYDVANSDELCNTIRSRMENDGYKLKKGTPANGTYTRGNRVMRVLFGAFSKFDKCEVIVKQKEEGVVASFSKGTTGMSGGLIGMNQVKKEFKRLNSKMREI